MNQFDEPDDDGARISKVKAAALELSVKALQRDVCFEKRVERVFVERICRMIRDGETCSDEEEQRIQQLRWKYRRQLPKHLAPKVNPQDPIVMEMEKQRV